MKNVPIFLHDNNAGSISRRILEWTENGWKKNEQRLFTALKGIEEGEREIHQKWPTAHQFRYKVFDGI